jgi:hypothetical protein
VVSPVPNPTSSPADNEIENRSFAFYLQCVAPSLAGCLDEDLWRTVVPQICHSSRPICRTVLAISTFYEHPLVDAYHRNGIRYNSSQRKAVAWYKESVTTVLSGNGARSEQEQLESSLLTSLLFAAVEIQHGMVHNTLGLLLQSYKLMGHYMDLTDRKVTITSAWITGLVCPFLARQAVLFTLFGQALPPEAYEIIQSWLSFNLPVIHSLATARDGIYALLLRGFRLVQATGAESMAESLHRPEMLQELSKLSSDLQRWQNALDLLASEHLRSDQERAVYHTLCCYHRVAVYWLRQLDGSLIHDGQPEDFLFEDILQNADAALKHLDEATGDVRNIPLTLEPGVVPPLFFVGWQCRTMSRCRQALGLMRRAPAQESLFVTALQINALEMIMAIEEGSDSKLAECEAKERARLPYDLPGGPRQYMVSKYPLSKLQLVPRI